jgi:HTH-type transcriptional regulator / antitoxin HipB
LVKYLIYTSNILKYWYNLINISKMKTLAELGRAVAEHRKKQGLPQGQVAKQSGLTQESLSRFENGQLSELGSRKLLAVLAVLGLEMSFTEVGMSGTLDELRRERGGA